MSNKTKNNSRFQETALPILVAAAIAAAKKAIDVIFSSSKNK